jgi:hypothetical protein
MTVDEAKAEAERVRVLHKVPGVFVLSLEVDGCAYGLSILGHIREVAAFLPDKLREVAAQIERTNVAFEFRDVQEP